MKKARKKVLDQKVDEEQKKIPEEHSEHLHPSFQGLGLCQWGTT